MTRLVQIRLLVAAIGVVVWGYGVFADEPVTRLVGIALFAVALVLRFAGRRQKPRDDATGPLDSP